MRACATSSVKASTLLRRRVAPLAVGLPVDSSAPPRPAASAFSISPSDAASTLWALGYSGCMGVSQAVIQWDAPRVGGAALLQRVSEMVFVDATRRYLDSLPEQSHGWLGALRDRQVGRALSLMHADPTDPRGTRPPRGPVTLGTARALRRLHRPAAHAVPDPLAHPVRRAAAARGQRRCGGAGGL